MSIMKFNKVTHVIFDMDGLLIDSETLYSVAFQNVVGKFGKTYTWELKLSLMGKQIREVAQIIIQALELPMTVDEFVDATKKQFEELFPKVNLMPGAQKILEHFYKCKVPFALATSSSKENADLKLVKHTKLFELFNHKIFGSSDPSVKRGKPDPDIFLVCASKFPDSPKPSRCLVFEDSPNGVKAAKAAGMQVVMVPDPKLDRSLTEDATLVIASLEEFKPEWFGLPPY